MPVNTANPNIKHVFVLMLENRSYDHMLGFLNTNISQYNNVYNGTSYNAKKPALDIMPDDPKHEFEDVMEQLCGKVAMRAYQRNGIYPEINNSGFVSSYADIVQGHNNQGYVGEIMNCYDTASQLPVMAALANEFAVCNQWYSSLPGPTWPNRFFVHAASSAGLDRSPKVGELIKWNLLKGFSFPKGTIFHSLKSKHKNYRLYRGRKHPWIGSIPSVAALRDIHLKEIKWYDDFEDDVMGEYQYEYTFIEPNYGDVVFGNYAGGQSQHPRDDVRGGEALIKATYEAIRNSPLWEKSLLIITYDEHGGFYDHFPPPAATPPGDNPGSKFNKFGFKFDRYGVRVPAIVVSAYTPTIIDTNIYDHSSVLATLEALFDMPALTMRDANANNVCHLAALDQPRSTPEKLPDPAALLVSTIKTAIEMGEPQINEETESVDEGNLPGFLHVIMKADLENRQTKSLVELTEIPEDFKQIKTKAQAREYIVGKLPGLLEEGEVMGIV